MKQLSIIGLIWELFKLLLRYGNMEMWYHVCGGDKKCPIEVEEIEVRKDFCGETRLTIY